MKFGSKHIFTFLFTLAGVAALYMGAMFAAKWVMYTRYANVARGTSTYWGVISLTDDKHHICTDYNFFLTGESFCAQYVFPKPVYSTKEAALEAMEEIKKDEITVWYWQGKGGAPISTLERTFPMNELIRFGIIIAILLYFSFLKNYFGRFAMDESASS